MFHPPPVRADDRLPAQCLLCGRRFEPNYTFDGIPRGQHLAYDPDSGRIWCICTRCRRWSLMPIEDRFDAAERLERLVRDRGHLLGATANIALHECDELLVVRIGPATFVERSAWRFGRELVRRGASYHTRRTRIATGATDVLARTGEAFGVWSLDRDWGPSAAADVLRWQRFGTVAWRGRTPCPYCGSVLHTLHFDTSWWLRPRIEDGRLVVGVPCTRCDPWTPRNVWDVSGESAQRLLRRALAYQHVAGAGERDVTHATRLITAAGSPEDLLREVSDGRTSLWSMGRTRTIALEIATSQIAEQHDLTIRLRGIEAEWRLEEALARIIDDELS